MSSEAELLVCVKCRRGQEVPADDRRRREAFVEQDDGQCRRAERLDQGRDGRGGARGLISLAQAAGKDKDRRVRQDLMKLHTAFELARMNNLRAKDARKYGKSIPGLGNIAKLSMSEILRMNRDIALGLLGPAGTLHGYSTEDREAVIDVTGNPFLPALTEAALFAQGPAIYGGTDQIQKNIIGERVLGLPKEPNKDKVTPFKELPKNG